MEFKVYRISTTRTPKAPIASNGSVVAIGNFDGVHRGHKALIKAAKIEAQKQNIPLIVLTFEPHPRQAFHPNINPIRLTPFADKCRRLRELGANGVCVAHFTKAFAQTSAENFMEKILRQALSAKTVFVGKEFRFGKGREGTVETLQKFAAKNNMNIKTIEAVSGAATNGEKLGSTAIRHSLALGHPEQAAVLLGRPYMFATGLYEDEKLNLVGNINKYTAIAEGAYWARIAYGLKNEATMQNATEFPVTIYKQRIIIQPLANLPDIPEGRYRVELLSRLNTNEKEELLCQ